MPPESFQRMRRIVGRIVNRKTLPQFLYRWDQRPPNIIRSEGFKPWNENGTVELIEHVTGSYSNDPRNLGKQGSLVKYNSQWVSTGAYGMVKNIDPVFAQQVLNTHLYKIDTSIASLSGPFYDVNDHFDRAGINRPYATQREWAKLGSIPANAVVSYMTGKDYFEQYDLKIGAPEERLLKNWQTL
ncbi:scabin-related ADP-ribosyltransferase [Pigmentibacter ruber]|uniref:scabin-related ADP-ribosyltransferase n=1 Tax=Pigmentibacter ruber TaxID=2683196 RepID=UPI00131BB58A|nr:hypothetical protein [Pigmentibacter ruber]